MKIVYEESKCKRSGEDKCQINLKALVNLTKGCSACNSNAFPLPPLFIHKITSTFPSLKFPQFFLNVSSAVTLIVSKIFTGRHNCLFLATNTFHTLACWPLCPPLIRCSPGGASNYSWKSMQRPHMFTSQKPNSLPHLEVILKLVTFSPNLYLCTTSFELFEFQHVSQTVNIFQLNWQWLDSDPLGMYSTSMTKVFI